MLKIKSDSVASNPSNCYENVAGNVNKHAKRQIRISKTMSLKRGFGFNQIKKKFFRLEKILAGLKKREKNKKVLERNLDPYKKEIYLKHIKKERKETCNSSANFLVSPTLFLQYNKRKINFHSLCK